MEVVSALISPIVESLMVPVKQHMSFAFSSTKYVTNLNNKMKQLDAISHDVKHHMETNKICNLDIPARVTGWLEDVGKIKEEAQSISSTGNICFNLKMRYRGGRKAFKITLEIEGLIKENIDMIWTDAKKPLGKVNSQITSANSALSGGDAQNDFQSRDKSFKEALEFLQQDHKGQVIALCGMGGVGKTTMMEQLIKMAQDKSMFDYVVKVVIGQQVNMLSIQQTVAEYMIQSQSLTETSIAARADRLRVTFGNLPQGKRRVLVILDDVWETIELKDIGLNPLPNGFKLLLTSRSENICNKIAVEANSDLTLVRVEVMEEPEARNFFWKIVGVSKQHDQELNQIGSNIVRRCGFLPLAIKLIATTLKSQEAFLWRNTFRRLELNNLDKNVQEIIDISFDYIKEDEEKAIFLLCGLFPDDFNIPIEELTRYAWGLQLLNDVLTVGDARDRTRTCVQNLKSANLLMDSDHVGCVKMHDLVLAFVLGRVSRGDHPWMINHGDTSKWSTTGMSESCKSISITCTGMSEFPRDFKYTNLSLLRLRRGDKSLKFPQDFYEKMENLEVISYEKMEYPLLPRSLQCSTKLRTLFLDQCSLMSDWSVIGEILNLEVLSFAHCGIRMLPSAIGKLKKLKLLDLTGCVDLRIDDGILKSLVKLEELYMRVNYEKKAIKFTNENLVELAEISKQLSALEVEFFDNNGKPENMLFTKIERFRISMGRSLGYIEDSKKHSFENTLKLVTNKYELPKSRINELFKKTEVLHLEVDGMNDLEEVLVESVHLPRQSFNNLRVLTVSKCADLRYLFTVPMANGLMKLESLKVSECPVLEVLAKRENGGDAGVLKFQELKYLTLKSLPKLVDLCNIVNLVELPELVELNLDGLPNFTSIYVVNTSTSHPSNISAIQPFFNKECSQIGVGDRSNETCTTMTVRRLENINVLQLPNLKILKIRKCDVLEYIFSNSTLEILDQLKELKVEECKAMQVIVKEDGEHTEISKTIIFSCLKSLKLADLPSLKGFFLGKDDFQWPLLEKVTIYGCPQMTVFISGHSMSPKLKYIHTGLGKHSLECGLNFHLTNVAHETHLPMCSTPDMIKLLQFPWSFSNLVEVIADEDVSEKLMRSRIIFPCNELLHLKNLEKLCIFSFYRDAAVEEVFEVIEGTDDGVNETKSVVVFEKLNEVFLIRLDKLRHMWKSSRWIVLNFPNLTKMTIDTCPLLGHVFTSCMVASLLQLQELDISYCKNMDVIVKNHQVEQDSDETRSIEVVFPHLKSITLERLPNLKAFCLSKDAFLWPSLRTLEIKKCPKIKVFTSGLSTTPELKLIDTTLGMCDAIGNPNTFINNKLQEGWDF